MILQHRAWRPLHEAMAWAVTRDEQFCEKIGADKSAGQRTWYASILLQQAMIEAGCFLPEPQGIACVRSLRVQTLAEVEDKREPEIVTKEFGRWVLNPGYVGRFRALAEEYENEGWRTITDTQRRLSHDDAFSKLGISTLDAFLCGRWHDAFTSIAAQIAKGSVHARGRTHGGQETVESRDIPPASMTCKPYLSLDEWIVWEGPEDQSRSWTHIEIDWTDLLKCFEPYPGPSAESLCQAWLEAEMQKSPDRRPHPRKEFLREALSKFSGLARVQFGRAWKNAIRATGATAWSDGGRPRNNPHEKPHGKK